MGDKRRELLADKQAIYELSCTYVRGQDRLDAVTQRSVFWDDAWCAFGIYDGGPDGFVTFVQGALAMHRSSHHMLGQVLIDVDGKEAFGEVYYQAYHRLVAEDGGERDLFVSGRYLDRYRRRKGTWKIAYRSELVDWVRDVPAADTWLEASAMLPGRRHPDDALYDRAAMRRRRRRRPERSGHDARGAT